MGEAECKVSPGVIGDGQGERVTVGMLGKFKEGEQFLLFP